jgi:hypothetical protein
MKEVILVGLIIGAMACGKAATAPGESVDVAAISEPGLQGPTGTAGESCTVEQTKSGALIRCPDGSSALLLHGQPVETCKGNGKHGKAHNHQDSL